VALPGDCPVTGHTPIPTVDWLGIGSLQPQTPNPNSNPNPKLTLPTQRSGAVPWDSSRLQAEEDIKELACIKSPFQGGEDIKLFLYDPINT
jgi:hypothetical protein